MEVIVVGAGVMGLWSALTLRERGHDVLLIDQWGPGNTRSTSGDENRVIRCGYGEADRYTRWARRSLRLWSRRQKEWSEQVLFRCGVLWMVGGKESFAEASADALSRHGIPNERFGAREMARRWPQIDPRGVKWAILEPESGTILARRSCQLAAGSFEAAGGSLHLAEVRPGRTGRGRLRDVQAAGGRRFSAEAFVFACGPWLPSLFPEHLRRKINVTRKEVFYFGTPAGNDDFTVGRCPVWLELGTPFYGIPSVDGRGFKVAPDVPGRRADPTNQDRRPSARLLAMSRRYLKRRFPALGSAPVIESRVCQYESTADDHFVIDRLPGWRNVWIVGGGSGHGFKHGPAIGELVAGVVERGDEAGIPSDLLIRHVPAGRHF